VNRKLFILALSVSIIFASFLLLFLNAPPEINQGIIIHLNGKYYKISPTESGYSELSNECMSILREINEQYKLGITMDKFNLMKRYEDYVEIVFQRKVNLTTNYKTIEVKGAVFVLSENTASMYSHIGMEL